MNLTSIVLDPEQLSTLYTAFDAAWEVVRHGYDVDNPVSIDTGRMGLANDLLSAYRRDITDHQELTAEALFALGVGL
jgi:hypothetical protein